MPKNKTHSGAKKRFRTTGSGKIMREQAGARHGDDTDGPKRVGRANDRADVAGVAPLGENDEGLPHARLR